MLNKHTTFVLLNLFSYLIILFFFGFEAAYPLSVIFSVIVFTYNIKLVGIKGSLTLAIIYLLAFDNEIFYFSELNIRTWYFYLIIIYFISFFEFIQSRKYSLKKIFLLEYIIGFIFFIWSLYFLIIEDFISRINNIKYWLFYIGLILVLNNFFKKHIEKYQMILNFILSITVFIMFWGVLQFFTNLLFLPNFQLDYFNIRPSAFFSETTWYSEFIFFGLLLLILNVLNEPKKLHLLYLVPFFIVGFLFSVTRNTYLALFLYLFFTFILTFFLEKKIFTKIIASKFIKIAVLAIVVGLVLYIPQLKEITAFFELKFSGQDDSAQGRLEAYKLSMNAIFDGNIFGSGFYWDKSYSTESGSALGSKSFNIFLMMGSIFGSVGGLLFIIFIIYYLIKNIFYYYKTKSMYIKYSFISFIVFIQMAMFAPIHQYPFGMLIVSLSVFLFNIGIFKYEKNNICNSTI